MATVAEDWQATKESVRERTAFLFNNSLFSDINFVVAADSTQVAVRDVGDSPASKKMRRAVKSPEDKSDDETSNGDSQQKGNQGETELPVNSNDSDVKEVRVPAHKLVLAMSSPVFEAMFYGNLAERRQEINLPDTRADFLLEFLRFLYRDEISLSAENVFGVLYLADKYMVPSLVSECWEFIDQEPCACLKSVEAVSTLDHGTLVSLLKRDSLCAREYDLFNAVSHWAEARCRENGSGTNGKTIRAVLGDAVEHIRFPTMSRESFAGHVVPRGVLSSDEALQVHQYYSRKTVPEMKFPTSYRSGLVSKAELLEYVAYSSLNSATLKNVELRSSLETLDISVESRNIHLKGISMVTSKKAGEKFRVSVALVDMNDTELASKEQIFFTKKLNWPSPGKSVFGFDVKFQVPVLLWRLDFYRLYFEVEHCTAGTELYRLNQSAVNLMASTDGILFRLRGPCMHVFKLLYYDLE